MRFIYPVFIRATLIVVALFSIGSISVFAQENEPVVIDEVVVQANEGVITLSLVKREIEDAVQGLIQTGMKEDEARKKVMEQKAQLILSLIDEILIMQKGKELGLAEEVEAEVNKRFLEIAAQQKIKTIEELYRAMKESGVDPEAIRQKYRAGIMKDTVLGREVDSVVYYNLSEKELKEYFQKNPDKFKKPEEVVLSEIFLSFAGRDEKAVEAQAADLVKQIRAGADFGEIAIKFSERTDQQSNRTAPKDKGRLPGKFALLELRPDFTAALKTLKVGGVTDPIRVDEGIEILRIEERTAGADTPTYNERRVREVVAYERIPNARKKYIEELRADSYIKLAEAYRPLVGPLITTATTPNAVTTASKEKEKEKEKKDKKKN